MIDVEEYTRFLELEARMQGRPLKPPYIQGAYAWKPPGEVLVWNGGPRIPNKYDYFLHPRWGVVKALNDGGTLISKSPVCEALDRELFDL